MKKIVLALALLCGLAAPTLADSGSAIALVDAGVSLDAAPAPAVIAPPSFVVDPAHPIDDATTAWALVKQAGWLWGGMAILFALGTYAIKKNEDRHWLGNDHVLAIGTTVLGVMGAVINAHFGSGSWATVVAVLVAGVALIVQKPQPAGQKAP